MDTFEDLPLLVENQLVRARGYPGDPLYRIAWTGNGSLHTYLVRIDGADDWILALPTRTMQDRLAPSYAQTDALELVADDKDPYARAHFADPSERALKRYALIKDLVDGENRLRILAGVGTTALYEACAKRAGTTRQTIATWVKRYLTRGMCADALSGDWRQCGAPGRRRDAITKVGRSRKHDPCGKRSGTQVDERGRAILNAGYCIAKVNGYNYRQFKAYIDNKYCRDWPPAARFTLGQIRYYVRTIETPIQRRIRQHGPRHYALVDRPYDGQSSASGPGAEYQIDSTVGDVYLVSALDRLRVVGRPTIYLVTDTYSRLIVGIYVGFENPSFLGAGLAMESVVTPKVELCRRYGLSIEEWYWPSHHLGPRMMHDRAKEFMSWLAWRRLNVRYGVDFDNPPPFRPDWKAIVESRFEILNKEWGPYVPGHVEQDYRERGSHNYLLDATMTLREFTKLMLVMVVRYNIRPFDRAAKDPTFVAQGLADSPAELWRYGIEHYSGTLRTVPVEAMRACVYPRVAARVTREGIALGNRFYETERASREQWFVRARSEGTWKVELAFDPGAPESSAYVVHADGAFERATLRQTGAHYDTNPSLAEIALLNEQAAENYVRGVYATTNIDLDLLQVANDTIAEATNQTQLAKELRGMAVPCTKDTKAARQREREHERAQRAATPTPRAEHAAPSLEVEPDARSTVEWDDEGLADGELAAIKREREREETNHAEKPGHRR